MLNEGEGMPDVRVNGVELHYEETGSGADTVVFSHSYLLDSSHFQPQVTALAERFRCIAFDHRGLGRSEKARSGYDMENLYTDAVAFIEQVVGSACHFVGLSTGGYIGVRLGFRRPDLLRTLVLMDTSADRDAIGQLLKYKLLMLVAQLFGPGFIAKQAFPFLFGKTFRSDTARTEESAAWLQLIASNNRRSAIRFGKGIFTRKSVYEEISTITTPTLIVVGEEDVSTPVSSARRMAEKIPGSELIVIPHAGHICTVENPDAVNKALSDFFEKHCRD